eukprot:RCo048736
MKVVFLDIDGVLHPVTGGECFLPCCMDRLRRIVETTGAQIVLSSSWRGIPTNVDHVNANLQEHGIPKVIGKTSKGSRRAHQIACWLEHHPEVTHYVILDDADLSAESRFAGHVVRTASQVGLTDPLAELAVQILSGAALAHPFAVLQESLKPMPIRKPPGVWRRALKAMGRMSAILWGRL